MVESQHIAKDALNLEDTDPNSPNAVKLAKRPSLGTVTFPRQAGYTKQPLRGFITASLLPNTGRGTVCNSGQAEKAMVHM